jgi:serine phosphatase RsbU (regulator of sigma subunit)
LWLCLALIGAAPVAGQTVDLTKQTVLLADLSKAKWRFHPGDDPRWADPAFDDSQWPLLAGDRSWDEQGYKGYSGYAWYRIHLKLPPDAPFAIAPGHIHDSYEVFADGVKVGQWGPLSPGSVPLARYNAGTIQAGSPGHSGEIEVAIRTWHWSVWAPYNGGGFGGGPVLLGAPAVVADRDAHRADAAILTTGLPGLAIASASILAGLLALLLYLKERSSPEYFWFGLLEVCNGLGTIWDYAAGHWISVTINARDRGDFSLNYVCTVAFILFFFRFVGRPVRGWPRWVVIAQVPFLLFDMLESYAHPTSVALWNAIGVIETVFFYLTLLWLVAAYWKNSRAARRLAVPLVLLALAELAEAMSISLFQAGLTLQDIPPLVSHPFQLTYTDAAQVCFLAAMAYVLIERFAEDQAERTRLAEEFEAARTVQQVLIPDFLPPVPGLTVKSAYLPAQEVGGDFFQVLPVLNPEGGDGATFIVVGDVSGKGLKAAMTVSLIVGTLRTYAEFYSSPAELLAGLNRRLHGRTAGFATCLALMITREGEVTIANAGHPNPYLDGVEIQTDSNLPLGVTLDVGYAETQLHIDAGQRLTLVTDGVVEATAAATKELFGFERTQAISGQAAEAIAQAARAFGVGAPQADDITVLTVARTPVVMGATA